MSKYFETKLEPLRAEKSFKDRMYIDYVRYTILSSYNYYIALTLSFAMDDLDMDEELTKHYVLTYKSDTFEEKNPSDDDIKAEIKKDYNVYLRQYEDYELKKEVIREYLSKEEIALCLNEIINAKSAIPYLIY